MIYLASPYSSPDPKVREARFLAARSVTSRLLQLGVVVFSPIAYSHQFAEILGGHFEAWRTFNLEMIDRCGIVYVLKLDGWKESVGVAAEIEHAKMRGRVVGYLNAETLKSEPE